MNSDDPLSTPIQYVKGVGPYIAGLLQKKQVNTVFDLLYYFPHRYLDHRKIDTLRSLKPGKGRCVVATVLGSALRPLGRSRRRLFEITIHDETGIGLLTFFNFNEKFLRQKYPNGKKIFVAGECQIYRNQKQFVHPDIEDFDDENENNLPFVPIYPLTEGLYQKTIRKIIFNCVETYLDYIQDCPESVRKDGEVKVSLKQALQQVHQPSENSELDLLNDQKTVWHQRIIYDELFFLQLGLALKKMGYKKEKAKILEDKNMSLKAIKLLPFELTDAQKKVLQEISDDLQKSEPMNRLLQGDVGSGKTLVAFLSCLKAIENQTQAALMAPTEILATQHYLNLKKIADKLDVSIGLLTRTMPKTDKEKVMNDLKDGSLKLVIGTHAIIQDSVIFKNLTFIVIDEQHRFGVKQRAELKKKGENLDHDFFPHILVMTATPIPRTLSMSLYGDLDVSIIDEKPMGRKPVKTYVYSEKRRSKAFELIERELQKGRQVYFVYPLIEESEKMELKNATQMAEKLKVDFPKYKIGLLHGKMSGIEKEEVMNQFKNNEFQILVSTTVIEVGVDVGNATVMVVEHAERFGLSQLHQLRGRVGRNDFQSYCLLLAGYAKSEETRFRLNVMEETDDGFKISEEDLKLRGPGDFLGTRQHGLPEFRLAHLLRDTKLMQLARSRALEIAKEDPFLKKTENQRLKQILTQRWEGKLELGTIS